MSRHNNLPEPFLSNFKQGPDDFRPVVMWFWNGAIREDEIVFQLKLFKEQKLFHIFVHPTNGIEVEYLSDEYFRLFRFTVEQAKLIGLKIWIYDDYNWPSGSAGGYLLKEEPWTRGTVIRTVCKYLVPGQTITLQNEIISAQAVFVNNAGTETTVKNIVKELEKQDLPENQIRTSWKNTETAPCNVYMFYIDLQRGVLDSAFDSPFSWCQEGYLDTCNKDAVKRFIDRTHERYKQAAGDEFGKTVAGLFTDEPAISSPMELGKGTFPWTRDFAKIFQEKTGYDLLSRLCALCYNFTDPSFKKVRIDFWRVISDLFAENYMNQIAKWCEENKLLFTGHFCYEEKLIWHCMQAGDYFNSSSKFTIPGIDSIHSKECIDRKDFNVAGKLITSVADYTGRERVLCETYSCSGWDCNLFEMKRIANRLTLLGVNMIMLMGAYYTIRGRTAKFIGPPTHSWHNPLFTFYRYYSDYISRLTYINHMTEYEAEVLVMLPKLVMWEDLIVWDDFLGWRGTPAFSTKVEWTAEDIALQATVNSMVKANCNFLIGFEELLKDAKVENGQLHMGRQKFSILILPRLTNISAAATEIIAEFIRQDGKVLFINELPLNDKDAFADTNFEKLFDRGQELIGNSGIREEQNMIVEGLRGNVKLLFNNSLGKEQCNDFSDSLKGILKDFNLSRPIEVDQEGINIDQRKTDEADYYILFNDTKDHKKVTGSIAAGEELLRLDPDSGDTGLANWKRRDGGIYFDLDLAACDSTVLIVRKSGNEQKKPMPGGDDDTDSGEKTKMEISLTENQDFKALSGNILPLKFNFLQPEYAGGFIDNLHGLKDSGYSSEQFWIKGFNLEFPGGAGFVTGSYYICKSTFVIDQIPDSGLKLITEQTQGGEYILNGETLQQGNRVRFWDMDNLEYDVSEHVKIGGNELIFKGLIADYHGIHEMSYHALVGQFRLTDDERIAGHKNIQFASWTEQGFPYYSGTGRYAMRFNLETIPAEVILKIKTNDAVRVLLNSQDLGVRIWPPYEYDLTAACDEGWNDLIIEVTCTNSNMYTASIPSGLLAPPVLIIDNGA